jgi:hypothetical protein
MDGHVASLDAKASSKPQHHHPEKQQQHHHHQKPRQELVPTWANRLWNSRPREAVFETAQDLLRHRPILGVRPRGPTSRLPPYLTASQFFILFQVAFAAVPVIVFLGFVCSVTSVAFMAAAMFIVFWVSFALILLLVPALVCSFVVAAFLFGFTALAVATAWLAHNLWQGKRIDAPESLQKFQTVIKQEQDVKKEDPLY